MNESGQYHWESETFRNKYEALLYYMRALLNQIMKQPNCAPEIKDKCLENIGTINQLLSEYVGWYNNSYGNWGKKKTFNEKNKILKRLFNDLMEIDIFEH